MMKAQPSSVSVSVDVVSADEEDGGDEARLEQAHLHRLLGELEEDHGRRSGDACEDLWRRRLGAVQLQITARRVSKCLAGRGKRRERHTQIKPSMGAQAKWTPRTSIVRWLEEKGGEEEGARPVSCR